MTEFDKRLHAERLAASKPFNAVSELPDGAMFESEGAFFAKRGKRLLRWSFGGYVEALVFNPVTRVKLLTPPSITAILACGFQPRWHPSALQWEQEQ